MALSCYIGQTLFGILLFYGVGFGLGAHIGLVWVLLITLAVFLVEVLLAHLRLRYFHFGSLEWIWRMLTYGKYIKLRKK